jgi:hypothetical protein
MPMSKPTIDLASLPALDKTTGVFGSVSQSTATYDDRIVVLMVYVYDSV